MLSRQLSYDPGVDVTRAPGVHERALRGDFRDVEGALLALRRDASRDARGWCAALEALYALVRPERADARPSTADAAARADASSHEAARLSTGDDATAAAHAASHSALACVLRADLPGLEAWARAARAIPGATGARVAAITEAWRALLTGDAPDAEPVERAAARAGDAAHVVEAAAIRALAAMDRPELDEAVAIARRAARMARTEQLLIHEYLANLVLARARRATGRAYLAARIASALAQVAPEPWRPWLAWELTLAGHDHAAAPPGGSAAAWLGTALEHALGGDRPAFASAVTELRERTRGFAAFDAEAAALVTMLDPHAAVTGTSHAAAWCRGEAHAPPFGVRDQGSATHPAALIVWQPGAVPRRVLRSGIALAGLGAGAWTPGDDGPTKDGRTHAALAVLALAGPSGIEDRALFRAVYGFELVPVKHDGVFRVLLHRLRAVLAGAAAIDREDTRLVLRPTRPLACPDPRTLLPLEERILGLLAAGHGRVTARQIADELRIALRSVQSALGDLVETGACTMEREGRRVEYAVEDTTFYEPSLHRLAAPTADRRVR